MAINNEYLNTKLREILDGSDNFFDIVLALKEFEKEYKQSDFYRITKINLMDLIKDARVFYLTSVKVLSDKINKVVNNLDGEKIAAILDQGGSILEANNQATLAQLEEFKELGGADIIKNQMILNDRDKEDTDNNIN